MLSFIIIVLLSRIKKVYKTHEISFIIVVSPLSSLFVSNPCSYLFHFLQIQLFYWNVWQSRNLSAYVELKIFFCKIQIFCMCSATNMIKCLHWPYSSPQTTHQMWSLWLTRMAIFTNGSWRFTLPSALATLPHRSYDHLCGNLVILHGNMTSSLDDLSAGVSPNGSTSGSWLLALVKSPHTLLVVILLALWVEDSQSLILFEALEPTMGHRLVS